MLLTESQINKGLDFTLSVKDFPDAAKEPEQLIEGFKTFPFFFLQSTQTVEDIDGRIVPFVLTKPQRYIERECVEQQKYYNYIDMVILKGRQARISTYIARRGLHYALWHSHRYTIFANVLEDIAKEGIFEYVWGGYTSLKNSVEEHPFLKELTAVSRAMKAGSYIEFNGLSHGKVVCQAAGLNAVGKNYQFSHLSEVSRMTQFLDLWESFYQGIHKSIFHHLILESTARYTGAKFIEIFKNQWDLEKEKGKPPAFKAVFIPAYMVDEYMEYPIEEGYDYDEFWKEENEDLYGPERMIASQQWWDDYDKEFITLPVNFMKFRRDMIEGQMEDDTVGNFTRLDMFKQNFPMTVEEAELVVGDNVFDRKMLGRRKYFPFVLPPDTGIVKLVNDVPKFMERSKGEVSVWSYPEEGLWYTVGFDPSGGNGGDYACGYVWSPLKNHVAAKFKSNHWTLTEQAEIMIAIAMWYNNAILGYENNYFGANLLLKLLGQDAYNPVGAPYTRLYRTPTFNKKSKGQYGKSTKNLKYGFHTNLESKAVLVQILRDLFNDMDDDGGGAGLYSEELIKEAWFFRNKIDKDGKVVGTPHSPKGKNDDELISLSIAVKIAIDYMKYGYMQKELQIVQALNPYDDYEAMRKNAGKLGTNATDPNDQHIIQQINRLFKA